MSSIVSCSSAAHSVGGVMPSSARIVATASGWVMYGSPLCRIWSRWWCGDLVGPLDLAEVGLRVRRPHGPEQRLERGVDRGWPGAEPREPGPDTRALDGLDGVRRDERAGAVVSTTPACSCSSATARLSADEPGYGSGAHSTGAPRPGRVPTSAAGRSPGFLAAAPRPSRKPSSMSTMTPTTVAPARCTRSTVAAAVPPVASTSSTTSTRSPGAKASAWTSTVAEPYSRS